VSGEIKMKINRPEFMANMNRIQARYGVEIKDAFKRFFLKPLVQDIVKTTPPENKMQGVNAVFRDVGKVFQGVAEKARLVELKGMSKSADWPAQYPVIHPYSFDAARALHQARRDNRGRVRARGKFTFNKMEFQKKAFVSARKLETYKRQTAKAVGTLKAGWDKAAQFVGAKLPAWVLKVSRRAGSVTGDIDRNGNGVIKFTNATPWANNKRMNSIINFAIEKRLRDKWVYKRMDKWAKKESGTK